MVVAEVVDRSVCLVVALDRNMLGGMGCMHNYWYEVRSSGENHMWWANCAAFQASRAPLICCVQLGLKPSESAVKENTDGCLGAGSGLIQYPLVVVESNVVLLVPVTPGFDSLLVVEVGRGMVEVWLDYLDVTVERDW